MLSVYIHSIQKWKSVLFRCRVCTLSIVNAVILSVLRCSVQCIYIVCCYCILNLYNVTYIINIQLCNHKVQTMVEVFMVTIVT